MMRTLLLTIAILAAAVSGCSTTNNSVLQPETSKIINSVRERVAELDKSAEKSNSYDFFSRENTEQRVPFLQLGYSLVPGTFQVLDNYSEAKSSFDAGLPRLLEVSEAKLVHWPQRHLASGLIPDFKQAQLILDSLLVRVILHSQAGENEEAWSLAKAGFKLSQQFRGEGEMMTEDCGMEMEGRALWAMIEASRRMGKKELEELWNYPALQAEPPSLERIHDLDFVLHLGIIDQILRGAPAPVDESWAASVRDYATAYQDYYLSSRELFTKAWLDEDDWQKLQADYEAFEWREEVMQPLKPVINLRQYHYLRTLREAVRLVAALQLQKLETGVYPKTLDELVPQYFAETPQDHLAGGPFVYSRDSAGNVSLSTSSERLHKKLDRRVFFQTDS